MIQAVISTPIQAWVKPNPERASLTTPWHLSISDSCHHFRLPNSEDTVVSLYSSVFWASERSYISAWWTKDIPEFPGAQVNSSAVSQPLTRAEFGGPGNYLCMNSYGRSHSSPQSHFQSTSSSHTGWKTAVAHVNQNLVMMVERQGLRSMPWSIPTFPPNCSLCVSVLLMIRDRLNHVLITFEILIWN